MGIRLNINFVATLFTLFTLHLWLMSSNRRVALQPSNEIGTGPASADGLLHIACGNEQCVQSLIVCAMCSMFRDVSYDV